MGTSEKENMTLRRVLDDDRYGNLLREAQSSTAYGVSVEAMGREDLMVLVMLYAESSAKASREVLRCFDIIFGD